MYSMHICDSRSVVSLTLAYTLALTALFAFAPKLSQANQSTTKSFQAAPHLEVAVDPRIELLAAVQNLSDWEKFATPAGGWAKPNEPYRHDMDAWFAPYRNHPAVTQLNKLMESNFSYDAPVSWILHYDKLPTLKQQSPLDQDTLSRGGGQAKLDALAAAFRDFAKVSHFQEFFNKHRPLYERLASSYRQTSPGDDALALIECYYGERRAGYTVAIAPMFGGTNYGVRIPEGANIHIYNVGSPRYESDQYVFHRADQMSLMFHEFGHSFTNPAVDSDPVLRDKYIFLMPVIRYKMERQGYGSWTSVMYELMNRTNEIRLVQLYGDTALADDLEKNYIDRGFFWLPYTLERLREYEANRRKYPSYKLFIGRMFDVLDETSPVIKDGRMVGVVPKKAQSGSLGTVN